MHKKSYSSSFQFIDSDNDAPGTLMYSSLVLNSLGDVINLCDVGCDTQQQSSVTISTNKLFAFIAALNWHGNDTIQHHIENFLSVHF